MFLHFWQKFENSKWPPFLGTGKFLKIVNSTLLRYPVGRTFRRNRSISHSKEIEANLCFFAFLAKIQNGLHFWGEEYFFCKLAKVYV